MVSSGGCRMTAVHSRRSASTISTSSSIRQHGWWWPRPRRSGTSLPAGPPPPIGSEIISRSFARSPRNADRATVHAMNSRDVLGQSPAGGIALMRLLRKQYPTVPAVFYSRKATVVDVKAALDAGALDVLIKPHRSLEDAEAPRFREVLTAYCEGHGPAGAAPSADRALPHANTVDRGFARPHAARHGARPLG